MESADGLAQMRGGCGGLRRRRRIGDQMKLEGGRNVGERRRSYLLANALDRFPALIVEVENFMTLVLHGGEHNGRRPRG